MELDLMAISGQHRPFLPCVFFSQASWRRYEQFLHVETFTGVIPYSILILFDF